MRDTMFRGKRFDNGKWTYGYLFRSWSRAYLLWGTTNDIPNMIGIVPESVGQSIGVQDIDKKDIYEGDLLRMEDYKTNPFHQYPHEVKWLEKEAMWDYPRHYPCPEIVKIIGNIHEHSELLNK